MSQSRSIEELLTDLSYSFATPEAEHFFRLIQEKKYSQAKKMVRKYYSEEDTQKVIEYHRNLASREYSFQEISVTDFFERFPFKEYQMTREVNIFLRPTIDVILNYRGQILATQLRASPFDKDWMFWKDAEQLPLAKVKQIWLVNKDKK